MALGKSIRNFGAEILVAGWPEGWGLGGWRRPSIGNNGRGAPVIGYLVILACLPNGKGSKGNLNALIPLSLIMGICNRYQ